MNRYLLGVIAMTLIVIGSIFPATNAANSTAYRAFHTVLILFAICVIAWNLVKMRKA